MTEPTRAWIDASAGVAGDMLLGALVDAGASVERIQAAVDAVIPGSARLDVSQVTRAGQRAAKVDVAVLVADPPHRTWHTIRGLLEQAELTETARGRALAVFGRLATAEGRVHGVPAEEIEFHEVGALDAIADVVGTCAALDDLGATAVVVSPIALGSGRIRAHHGELGVPVPAVLELTVGWDVDAGGEGELATPTGVALVTALASSSGPLPAMRVHAVGVGAGTRDVHGRANVVRVVLGAPVGAVDPHDGGGGGLEPAVVLEANVDDLDPRVWPEVLARLLDAGASDAWLTPVLMKKGRPAHTLHALAEPALAPRLSAAILRHTTTLGVRRTEVAKDALSRDWVVVRPQLAAAPGQGEPGQAQSGQGEPGQAESGQAEPGQAQPGAPEIRIKVGWRDGRIARAMPEFADVVTLADDHDLPVADVLTAAHRAAGDAGLVPGAPWPPVSARS
ncbi:nickel pincer cofactor biosynthesis protein LarC [Cellulomonas fimi]|uniref:Pyridinium-3,5-bisthiocarboxylic acid mononucleotide nickel insertion protein n=1 Tax=Cellulomonas fimi TaxID=1708 RepID=A0A7Y0M0H6_CELFI|nr:nickel pincer cofactor biosynthesis protein LarC [Cellulomonas fimi]NMR21275.1 nickel pincer cofactor biosynthesis protein LarC [Cellulomonas fimi]